ncbi:MAG: 16S rRNA (cytosine(1402)-N(4))-methyltransferase RsmH [Acidobacteria bacterium]|nr:16S rRNA (cytosine(1402)-N(4))-methyltransferase RsmH [Acidobacteriota bacterium]
MAHVPVLLDEVIRWLRLDPAGTFVDCTLGGGGYAEAILKHLTTGRLIAIDRDPRAIEAARERLRPFGNRIIYWRASYSEIGRLWEWLGEPPGTVRIAGMVADLGVSREQLEDPGRGFSFLTDGPLDMRLDPEQPMTAARIVNHYGEKPLAELIFRFGEERRSRRIARAIVRARPVVSTRKLAEVIERAAPRTPRERIHPATRTFQALRIAVNDELGELEKLLEAAPPLLASGGRLVVVSFHSLEDRLVKQALRRWAGSGVLEILTKHVIRPGEGEVRSNPASRSARLRAAEKRMN